MDIKDHQGAVKRFPVGSTSVLSFAGQTDPADRTFVQQIEKLLDAEMRLIGYI